MTKHLQVTILAAKFMDSVGWLSRLRRRESTVVAEGQGQTVKQVLNVKKPVT